MGAGYTPGTQAVHAPFDFGVAGMEKATPGRQDRLPGALARSERRPTLQAVRGEARRTHHLTGVTSDIQTGAYVDPRVGGVTVAEWWDEWWPSNVHLAKNSRDRDGRAFKNQVKPAFGTSAAVSFVRGLCLWRV